MYMKFEWKRNYNIHRISQGSKIYQSSLDCLILSLRFSVDGFMFFRNCFWLLYRMFFRKKILKFVYGELFYKTSFWLFYENFSIQTFWSFFGRLFRNFSFFLIKFFPCNFPKLFYGRLFCKTCFSLKQFSIRVNLN